MLAVAVGGVLVYLLARVHHCTQSVSVGFVAFYFLYPIVHYGTINDFHADPLAVPSILGALYAFDTRRWRVLAACLLLILLTKEQMVLVVFGLGVYWFAIRNAPRVGQLAIGAAALYAVAVLLPWYLATANEFAHSYSGYFSQVLQASRDHRGRHSASAIALCASCRCFRSRFASKTCYGPCCRPDSSFC